MKIKNESITLKQYVLEYIEENLQNLQYELNDILQIIVFVLDKDKNTLYINMDNIFLNDRETKLLTNYLDRLYIKHVPLQYIIGSTSFYKEQYIVNKSVLIPRADSEILVEKAIEYISRYNLNTMIDMCTGSGCIGISIAKNSNINYTYLVDISKEALEVTKKNVLLNLGNKDNVMIVQSDLFSYFINNSIKNIDIIVSNPPYIKTKDISKLSLEVQKEPILALDGGSDGIRVYEKILNQAKYILKNNGFLLFEIGFDELDAIYELVSKYQEYHIVEAIKDLAGNNRVVVCRFQKE